MYLTSVNLGEGAKFCIIFQNKLVIPTSKIRAYATYNIKNRGTLSRHLVFSTVVEIRKYKNISNKK